MVESGLVLPSAPWPSLGELNLDSGAAQVKVSDELCSACQARDIGHLASPGVGSNFLTREATTGILS